MNNILRFPLNAPMNILNIAKNLDQGTNESADEDAYPLDDSLLASLMFLRDCLASGKDSLSGSGKGGLSAQSQHLCLEAVDHALNAAMGLERTVLKQTLHIKDMARIACTDQLTGAYNRRGFEQELQRTLAAATRYDETGILVYIDLDGFKPINDTYGHAAGDQVLIEVVRILQSHIRPQDMVARIGGDEFTVLLTRTDWENGLERAETIKHMLNTMYVRWNGKNISVRASLGFQRYGANADAELLLTDADSAMFEAKRLRGSSRQSSPEPSPAPTPGPLLAQSLDPSRGADR